MVEVWTSFLVVFLLETYQHAGEIYVLLHHRNWNGQEASDDILPRLSMQCRIEFAGPFSLSNLVCNH